MASALAPTLARLAFWIPPDRMAEFEVDYREKVVPIVKKHGLVESTVRGRATPDSVFTRLFEVRTPSEIAEKQKALLADPSWGDVLRHLGPTSGRARCRRISWMKRLNPPIGSVRGSLSTKHPQDRGRPFAPFLDASSLLERERGAGAPSMRPTGWIAGTYSAFFRTGTGTSGSARAEARLAA